MSKDPVSRISSGASAPSVERCAWATGPLLTPYHDEEWGVPAHDDRTQFEFLVLEAAQAGLSWLTVLRKRDGYRQAFGGFDASRVAEYGEREIEALMEDQGIIRNRQKITAAVGNAQALLRVAEEHGSFSQYLWEFAGGSPVVNKWREDSEIPAQSDLSVALSKDLRKRGFSFVGPVVTYSHLQATGVVMDHITSCYRHADLAGG